MPLMTCKGQNVAQGFTFLITENCNLRCKYCYEENKQSTTMSLDTAKKAIQFLKNSEPKFKRLNVDFIGGEPLLEVELIQSIIDEFKEQFKGHIWENEIIFSACTNGTQFYRPEVREFLLKNKDNFFLGISLDGIKLVHDMNRSGSYDEVMKYFKWWKTNFPFNTTKSTINHDSLPFLFESFKHLSELGIRDLYIIAYTKTTGKMAILKYTKES